MQVSSRCSQTASIHYKSIGKKVQAGMEKGKKKDRKKTGNIHKKIVQENGYSHTFSYAGCSHRMFYVLQ